MYVRESEDLIEDAKIEVICDTIYDMETAQSDWNAISTVRAALRDYLYNRTSATR